MPAITENISKKRRRGRPYSVFTDANDMREMIARCRDVRTERSVANRLYYHHALSVIGGGRESDLHWLADVCTGRYRRTILTELGRIDDEDLLLDVALDLCQKKPKTVKAVSLIRQRRGVLKPPSVLGIRTALRVSINRWRAANPAVGPSRKSEPVSIVKAEPAWIVSLTSSP